jgi:hypothetical protein
MLWLLVLLVMVAVGYAMLNEGLMAAMCAVVNVLLAGLVACWLFEPVASELGKIVEATAFAGAEDGLALGGLFAASYAGLRVAVSHLSPQELDLPARVQQVSSGLVGLLAGYLLAGFLVVTVSTLPLPEKFLDYEARVEAVEPALRRYFPPDRVWLGLMHGLGKPTSWGMGGETFDPEGTFALRYAKKRRLAQGAAGGIN